MSAKRKAPSLGLERRVRPRKEDEWEPEIDESDGSSAEDDDVSEEGIQREDNESDDGDSASDQESGSDSEAEEDDDDAPSKPDLSAISFGALARAQASLPPSERQLKKQRRSGTGAKEDGADSDSDGRPQNPRDAKRGAKPVVAKRSSKHAPQEQSSKRPVSRRREILPEEKKRAPARDPRFDPLSTGGSRHPDDTKTQRAYAFLDEYRDKEMAEMRAEAKKTKDPARREELKRRIMSMESRRRAQRQKDEERRLLAEHRQREKELVAQGKKPFYLKRSEQKKQLLTNKFDKMSKGQVDKAIERKRKKVAGKEKKELGSMQRVTDRHGR